MTVEVDSVAFGSWTAAVLECPVLTAKYKLRFLPADRGECSLLRRFVAIPAPCVGQEVSMAFNGDYYPVGHITYISPAFRVVTTSDGKRFYRQGRKPRWCYRRIWSLTPGHHDRQNQEG